MAYFCGLCISSDVLTPDSILFDLFGLKIPLLLKKKSSVCMCKSSFTSVPIYCMCSFSQRPQAQLSWRWDTGAPMARYCDIIKEELLNLGHNIVKTQNFTSANFWVTNPCHAIESLSRLAIHCALHASWYRIHIIHIIKN